MGQAESIMRIDKWLKIARLIKRRTVAQMACEQGRIYVNDRPAKPASAVKDGDRIHIELGSRALTVQVLSTPLKTPPAQEAHKLYQLIEEIKRPRESLSWQEDSLEEDDKLD
jgi:ribosomal 50S subunit-recycling heat shock protein